MGIFVITCFKPKEGMEKELLEVVKDHIPVLKNENLISDKVSHVMRSKNGCIIEVFEWKSQEAINDAHKNKNILELWKRFENVCEYIPLSDLEETKGIFPGFEPIEF